MSVIGSISWIDNLEKTLGEREDQRPYEVVRVLNDAQSYVEVHSDKMVIHFYDDDTPYEFSFDQSELSALHEKIRNTCKVVCFDREKGMNRRLKFELDKLPLSSLRTIRISILKTESDNFRVEVGRAEFLASLERFCFSPEKVPL